MKISNAVSSALSVTKQTGNLRIARSSLIKSAHLIERIGLAAVGASCGLYVGATLLRQKDGLFESGWIVLLTMLYGALSYYVGIDLSRSAARRSISSISDEWNGFEAAEVMSAAGTFGAAIAATLSVSILVLDQTLPNGLIGFVAGCWVVGSSLQVCGGDDGSQLRSVHGQGMNNTVLTEKRLLGVVTWAQAAVLVSASGPKVSS
ncbi:hypothetical protein ABIA99_003781 [Bradyrhizobium sp. LB12.1]|uniref:hypothetical protein n=1 Tax=Bradyrhizobium sp. LB12.1 TaxID=3156327 RepID=UPI00339A3D38